MGLRLGLAGLGNHGRRYARHLLAGEVAGARLTAVSRRDRDSGLRFARDNGLSFVPDPSDLAARDDVDAVVVVLSPDLHPATASAALSAGKPVLVEKPLAPDVASARDLAGEVSRTGTLLMVAHTLRFDPLIERMKREAATLGALRMLSINQRFEPSGLSWIDRPGAGGIVLNTGVHGFDLLRFFSGREAVSVRAECRRTLTRQTEDQFSALVRLEPDGVQAVLDNSRATRSRSGRIEIVCEAGQLWGDHIHRTLQRVRGREVTDLGPVPALPTIPRTLEAFVRCVREDTPPPVGVADGVAAVEMVEAALLSARRGGGEGGTVSISTPDG